MARKKLEKNDEKGGSPPWLTTYSDLMSLLLTFFILLYSMSNIDAQKFKNIAYSLQIALSGGGSEYIFDQDGLDDSVLPPTSEEGEDIIDDEPILNEPISPAIVEMYNKVSEYLVENNLGADVSVRMQSEGVFVEIKDAILFEPGSAELKESGIELLDKLEGLLKDFDNKIVVEGHTDNVPSRTYLYPTNWELSTARAVSVLRYLTEQKGIDPKRLSARGYGEYSPIAPNDTPENRTKNRRVNLLIVFEENVE
jgi:chemotaxis protein MotB